MIWWPWLIMAAVAGGCFGAVIMGMLCMAAERNHQEEKNWKENK